MSNQQSGAQREIEAMRKVSEALKGLDGDEIRNVLTWARAHFGVSIQSLGGGKSTVLGDMPEAGTYDDVAALFVAADPKTEAEKALIVAYWFQFVEGEDRLEAQAINSELRDLGHRASNITRAMSSLMKRKPQLAIQIRKSGSSKQARKLYRLTDEGRKQVEQMLRGGQGKE